MAIYFINILIIIVLGFFLLHTNPSKEKKKFYCVICSFQWILLSGLRAWTVGNDTREYAKAFEQGFNTSWSSVFANCRDYLLGKDIEGKDPGYFLLQKIFQIFFDDYQLWLLFIAIVFMSVMGRWIYKYSSMPDISFLVFSVLFYAFYAETGHRQTLATALVVFIGYEFSKKRQLGKFAIVAFIAFMLHKSSVVFILYYLIAEISITPLYILAMVVISYIVSTLGTELYGPIALMLGFADEQVEYSGGGAETYATVLLILCVVSFCFYPWINKKRKDSKYIYNMVFLTVLATLFVYQNQSFMRVQQYFSLIIMIIIPELIQAFEKKYRVFPYLFVVGFLMAYFLQIRPEYKFFFMN